MKMIVCNWFLLTLCVISSATADERILTGPIIEPFGKEVVLKNGQNFTLQCKAKNKIQFKQQDLADDMTGPFYSKGRVISTDDAEYPFRIALDLVHVNEFAVGYYACFDETVNSTDVLNNVVEEQENTAHISYIYVYVNGTESLFTSMRQLVTVKGSSKFVVGCRPTSPDIEVVLTGDIKPKSQSGKTIEQAMYSPKIGFIVKTQYRYYTCEGRRGNQIHTKIITEGTPPPKPKIFGVPFFLEGETFSLNCTADMRKNSPLSLEWRTPYNDRNEPLPSKILIESNEKQITTEGLLYKNLTVINASKEDSGIYKCISKSMGEKETALEKIMLKPEQAFINLSKHGEAGVETDKLSMRWRVKFNAYPPAILSYKKNFQEEIFPDDKKYLVSRQSNAFVFTIQNLVVTDTGNYTIMATNGLVTKNITYELKKKAAPTIDFGREGDKKYVENTHASLQCDVTGFPLPEIMWYFKPFCNSSQCQMHNLTGSEIVTSLYQKSSILNIAVHVSGNVTCVAINSEGNSSETRRFLVYEVPGGFGIKNSLSHWYAEYDNVTLMCVASVYDYYNNLTWTYGSEEHIIVENVKYYQNEFSYVSELNIFKILPEQAGEYTCSGLKIDNSYQIETVSISVEALRPLIITDPSVDMEVEVFPFQSVELHCIADGVPKPIIHWYKDGESVITDNETIIETININRTVVESFFNIKQMTEDHRGKYECVASSRTKLANRLYNLNTKENATHKAVYLSIIGIIVLVFLMLVVYLIWKIKKEKRIRKELAKAGLLYFKEGATHCLNPELGIDEQAELLPYDEKFEFPAEKLTMGKQLGAGAFGVVYKAEARGIVNAEETTTVAVKMVKKTADNLYIRALASELKIMVHLGKHINIVNLLGACTKNVGKRELSVIVEYCKFGNIHNYMIKHREVFIDQLTDNIEKNMGRINRGFSCSSGNSGSHSDYFGSDHTQITGHTFINSGITNKSTLGKVSESEYVQPIWRSNYTSDYSYDGRSLRPLCSRDLLCWAFQIARGMEYLASRKVLHGDLAARNVLLAEDNVVKICDFGLARSIYKTENYQKKEDSPLPVKWLAVECMTDRIFSTQSDVWSFGIVLWELFSLAKTPYPDISASDLLQWLLDGHRMKKPQYADNRLFEVMQHCWEDKPTARPSFSELQETIGSFLEDSVRSHYVELNSHYMDMNILAHQGHEDYLAMVNAPDYRNLVIPSPHDYVNSPFFDHGPTLQHDDEGYLQMSPAVNQVIFSPRPQGDSVFAFDMKKYSPRANHESEAAKSTELTPMLTLNNLPARSGSESDYESSNSPYLNMCPRIEEETDDSVFETKNNIVNIAHNRAVTNPTYITLDVDLEKKPQENNYSNIPNGLVK